MNINYLKRPGAEPGTWLSPASLVLKGCSLTHTRGSVGPSESLVPSPGEARMSCDSWMWSGSGQASCPGQLVAKHLSIPQCGPHSALQPGASLVYALPVCPAFGHKSMVSWKEIWAPKAKEPEAVSSFAAECCVTLEGHPTSLGHGALPLSYNDTPHA